MLSEPLGYILRIQRDELERQLFSRRVFYVNISRDWSRGTTILFVKKDVFIGSGTIDLFVTTDEMDVPNKKICMENNWYGKIIFSRLVRFVPPVMVQETPATGQNPLALHGASLSSHDMTKIEGIALGRIIS